MILAENLIKALKSRGLKLRDDSRLCKYYIEDGDGTLQEIVEIMHEMDWFFSKTNYRHVMSSSSWDDYVDDYDYLDSSETSKRIVINRLVKQNYNFSNAPPNIIERASDELVRIDERKQHDEMMKKNIELVKHLKHKPEDEHREISALVDKRVAGYIRNNPEIKHMNIDTLTIHCNEHSVDEYYINLLFNKMNDGRCSGECCNNTRSSTCSLLRCGGCCIDPECPRHS